MGYLLNSTSIRTPNRMSEDNSTQFAANRTLGGSNTRDYFGNNKRIWTLEYDNLNITDYAAINTLYQLYLSTKTALSWQITETNYTVAATTVLVDFTPRRFTVPGDSYIANCTLILTEA